MLLLVGLFSRPIAFILSGDMAVAYFMAHFPKNWLPILNGGDLAVLDERDIAPSRQSDCVERHGRRVPGH